MSLDQAIDWFRTHAQYNDFVLAGEQTSQVLAQKAGVRVYSGHEMETLDYKTKKADVRAFFEGQFLTATFPNEQVLDFDGIKGRVLSSSYMPAEGDKAYPAMVEELKALFDKHAESDRISVFYDTNVFYKQY